MDLAEAAVVFGLGYISMLLIIRTKLLAIWTVDLRWRHAIAVFTGILFILSFHCYRSFTSRLSCCLMVLVLILLAAEDLTTMEIPDVFHLFFILASWPIAKPNSQGWLLGLSGALAVSFPLLLLYWLWPGSIGGGDVKLMAVAGFILGPYRVVIAYLLACLLALIIVSYSIFKGIMQRKQKIPFGPFLAAGILYALLRYR